MAYIFGIPVLAFGLLMLYLTHEYNRMSWDEDDFKAAVITTVVGLLLVLSHGHLTW